MKKQMPSAVSETAMPGDLHDDAGHQLVVGGREPGDQARRVLVGGVEDVAREDHVGRDRDHRDLGREDVEHPRSP
jgi:hypothetical protein